MRSITKKTVLLAIAVCCVSFASAQTEKETAFVTTALSFADGQWPDKSEATKLDRLEPAAAVKYVAKKAGVISQSQSNALSDSKVISVNDQRVQDLKTIPMGFIIGFIDNGKITHVMISLGKGVALGTDNYKNLKLGNNDKWELLDLSAYAGVVGFATMKAPFTIVCKSVDQILNTNASKLPPAAMEEGNAGGPNVGSGAYAAAPKAVQSGNANTNQANNYAKPAARNNNNANAQPQTRKYENRVDGPEYDNVAIKPGTGVAANPSANPAENRRISDSFNRANRNNIKKSVSQGNLPLPGLKPGVPDEPTNNGSAAPAEPQDRPAVPAEPTDNGVTAPAEPKDNRTTRNNNQRGTTTRQVPPPPANENPVAPPEPQDIRTTKTNNQRGTTTTRQVPPAPANEKPIAPPEPAMPGQSNPSAGQYSSAGIAFNPMLDIKNVGKYTVKDWSSYGDPASPNPVLNQFAIFKQKKPVNSKIMNVPQYIAVAYNFFNEHPVAQEVKLDNGDLVVYDGAINLFAVYDKDGKPKEMYCPNSGDEVFNKYKLKAGQ